MEFLVDLSQVRISRKQLHLRRMKRKDDILREKRNIAEKDEELLRAIEAEEMEMMGDFGNMTSEQFLAKLNLLREERLRYLDEHKKVTRRKRKESNDDVDDGSESGNKTRTTRTTRANKPKTANEALGKLLASMSKLTPEAQKLRLQQLTLMLKEASGNGNAEKKEESEEKFEENEIKKEALKE